MTETPHPDLTETPPETPPVVPEGQHWSNLTVGELGYAGRELGSDIINAAATPDSPYRMEAYAWAAYLWARRTNPAAKVKAYTDLPLTEVARLLRLDVAARPGGDAGGDADSPTGPMRGSSSPAPGDASPTTS